MSRSLCQNTADDIFPAVEPVNSTHIRIDWRGVFISCQPETIINVIVREKRVGGGNNVIVGKAGFEKKGVTLQLDPCQNHTLRLQLNFSDNFKRKHNYYSVNSHEASYKVDTAICNNKSSSQLSNLTKVKQSCMTATALFCACSKAEKYTSTKALEEIKIIQQSQCFNKEGMDKEIDKEDVPQAAIVVCSILLVIIVALAAGIWVAWKRSLPPKVDYTSVFNCPDCYRRFEIKDDLEAHCVATHQYSYYERYETLGPGSPNVLDEDLRWSELEPNPDDPSTVEVREGGAIYTTG